MTNTATVLQEMLTENTGRSMLDSGDYYGRNWEVNQGRDFENEPEARLAGDTYGLYPRVNVYHWLKHRLDFRPDLTESLENYGHENEVDGMRLMEEWVEKTYPDATGIYGDGTPFTVNTYNHESVLSQVIQFHYFGTEDGTYVALQIHGGCDVRGGYTDPKVFELTDLDGTSILMDRDAGLFCDDCDARWWTDDAGYHWYGEGADDIVEDKIVKSEDLEEGEEFGEGRIVLHEGDVFCPCCGKGKLHASAS
jgi:hypothetical protein